MTIPSAMIFAAGFGTRMGALTKAQPKPMVRLAGRPMIDHTISHLREAGVQRVIANTHYLAEKIDPHLVASNVEVIREKDKILDTGGGLKNARSKLAGSPVITINPDVCWFGGNPITQMLNAWKPEMTALLLLIPASAAKGTTHQGDFSLEHGEIRRNGPNIYTGAQIIRTDRLAEISEEVFSLNLYWNLLTESGPLNGLIYDGDWCDIGSPDGLATAERLLQDV